MLSPQHTPTLDQYITNNSTDLSNFSKSFDQLLTSENNYDNHNSMSSYNPPPSHPMQRQSSGSSSSVHTHDSGGLRSSNYGSHQINNMLSYSPALNMYDETTTFHSPSLQPLMTDSHLPLNLPNVQPSASPPMQPHVSPAHHRQHSAISGTFKRSANGSPHQHSRSHHNISSLPYQAMGSSAVRQSLHATNPSPSHHSQIYQQNPQFRRVNSTSSFDSTGFDEEDGASPLYSTSVSPTNSNNFTNYNMVSPGGHVNAGMGAMSMGSPNSIASSAAPSSPHQMQRHQSNYETGSKPMAYAININPAHNTQHLGAHTNAATPRSKTLQRRTASQTNLSSMPDEDDTNEAENASGGGINVPIDELLTERQQKRQRLARKAELARVSRQQKKCRLDFLEKENVELMAQLDKLRSERDSYKQQVHQYRAMSPASSSHGSAGMMSPPTHHNHSSKMSPVQSLPAPALPNANASPISNGALSPPGNTMKVHPADDLQQLFAIFKAFGEVSRKAMDGSAGNGEAEASELMQRMLMAHKRWMSNGEQHVVASDNYVAPLLPIRFFYWLLSHNDQFYADQDSLWHDLMVKHMGCDASQIQQVYALRDKVKKQANVARQMDSSYTKLIDLLRNHYTYAGGVLEQLRAMLTPLQLSKYCMCCICVPPF